MNLNSAGRKKKLILSCVCLVYIIPAVISENIINSRHANQVLTRNRRHWDSRHAGATLAFERYHERFNSECVEESCGSSEWDEVIKPLNRMHRIMGNGHHPIAKHSDYRRCRDGHGFHGSKITWQTHGRIRASCAPHQPLTFLLRDAVKNPWIQKHLPKRCMVVHDDAKLSCGWPGIGQGECLKLGCCPTYIPTALNKAGAGSKYSYTIPIALQNCFRTDDTVFARRQFETMQECHSVPPKLRQDCTEDFAKLFDTTKVTARTRFTKNEAECYKRGCCFDQASNYCYRNSLDMVKFPVIDWKSNPNRTRNSHLLRDGFEDYHIRRRTNITNPDLRQMGISPITFNQENTEIFLRKSIAAKLVWPHAVCQFVQDVCVAMSKLTTCAQMEEYFHEKCSAHLSAFTCKVLEGFFASACEAVAGHFTAETCESWFDCDGTHKSFTSKINVFPSMHRSSEIYSSLIPAGEFPLPCKRVFKKHTRSCGSMCCTPETDCYVVGTNETATGSMYDRRDALSVTTKFRESLTVANGSFHGRSIACGLSCPAKYIFDGEGDVSFSFRTACRDKPVHGTCELDHSCPAHLKNINQEDYEDESQPEPTLVCREQNPLSWTGPFCSCDKDISKRVPGQVYDGYYENAKVVQLPYTVNDNPATLLPDEIVMPLPNRAVKNILSTVFDTEREAGNNTLPIQCNPRYSPRGRWAENKGWVPTINRLFCARSSTTDRKIMAATYGTWLAVDVDTDTTVAQGYAYPLLERNLLKTQNEHTACTENCEVYGAPVRPDDAKSYKDYIQNWPKSVKQQLHQIFTTSKGGKDFKNLKSLLINGEHYLKYFDEWQQKAKIFNSTLTHTGTGYDWFSKAYFLQVEENSEYVLLIQRRESDNALELIGLIRSVANMKNALHEDQYCKTEKVNYQLYSLPVRDAKKYKLTLKNDIVRIMAGDIKYYQKFVKK